MKRNMDLVRSILLELEGRTPNLTKNDDFGYNLEEVATELATDKNTLTHHLTLMFEAGLIDGWALRGLAHPPGKALRLDSDYVFHVVPRHLTWEGHEFLDSVRDAEIWMYTKSTAVSVGSFGFDTLKDLAKGFIKTKIKNHTGIEL
ncbi:DUF2513 domain-containing protein [Iodobacter fluviatilis]|uniref:Uncharacterized protein DUF2513 n=1 Tax=Iodobacter fluviatilis TaxID=537 RepID=A0A377SWC9_9NEIS|nr:DUF2513 domain-containing protein [Iodobacter fluviatilis]TCU88194.1 uncharacterized protein DUF2513 [Iodobacter fluviatilis]STR45695.1 Uncharacterised protein [Iodobacter fluviatilis]